MKTILCWINNSQYHLHIIYEHFSKPDSQDYVYNTTKLN